MYIWTQPALDYELLDVMEIFTCANVTVYPSPNSFRNVAPNQFNVYSNDYAFRGIDEVGNSGGGNDHLNVSQLNIDIYWDGAGPEDERLRDKICAFTIAHEMGHVLLGLIEGQHVSGSTDNVMTDSIQYVLPRMRTCEWPTFNTAQIQTIRRHYNPD
jgi:hypothetical protein